jgi:low temperature requirement protein LtrA
MAEVAGPAQRRLGPPFSAPAGQGATFVELFFDLVFVFALTEVTALTLHDLDWEGAARSVLIFWMIWWAWTQWTWALNPTDTDHGLIRLATLGAVGVAFIMAASVGQAFGDGGLWFAIPYVAVRVIAMGLYLVVSSADDGQFEGVKRFTLASIPGMAVVIIGGAVDGDARAWLWLVAVLLDVGATVVAAGYEDWHLRVDHFVERHALFVIIALGESLVVVGVTVAAADRSGEVLRVAIGAVAVTCLLWWTYFGWLKDALEVQLEREPGATEGILARDAFSIMHFPLVGGVIGIAVGFEEMVLHPGDHLETAGLVALVLGLVLFVGGGALSWARAGHQVLLPRIAVLAALVVALVLVADQQPAVMLTIIGVAIAAIAVLEQVMHPARAVIEAETG